MIIICKILMKDKRITKTKECKRKLFKQCRVGLFNMDSEYYYATVNLDTSYIEFTITDYTNNYIITVTYTKIKRTIY